MGKYVGIENILEAIQETLIHITKVQRDIAELTYKSSETLIKEFSQSGISISAESFEAIQLQDIIAQQYTAIIEAVEDMEKNITAHLKALRTDNEILYSGLQKLHIKMEQSLKEAKRKREAFAGLSFEKEKQQRDELEFFN